MAGDFLYLDELASAYDDTASLMSVLDDAHANNKAAESGTQASRSWDSQSGSNPYASALSKGAADLTKYGINELFKDRSRSLAPVAYKVASSLPDYSAAFSPSAMAGFSPSWGFSASTPSLAPAATQQAAALPNYSSVFAPRK